MVVQHKGQALTSAQSNGLWDSAEDMELLYEEKHMLRKLIQNKWHQQ